MSEQTIDDVVQSDAEELASANAGYNKTRGDTPPVEVAPTATEVEKPAAVEPQVDLAQELAALKAKVATSSGDSITVRKLHGEIGNINRTLKALTAKPAEAPVNDEFTAAMLDAEAAAAEFPEVVAPLVKALKVSMARQSPVDTSVIEDRISTAIKATRENDAIESLKEEHPDYETVRETPEYNTWLSSKPPEFQHRFTTTWNPAVVARGLTEFKDSLKAKERKQNRLESAVTPQGVPVKPQSSSLPDDAGFAAGYYKGQKRR
jgi:hypothetical protein